jgi:hypothetical protein
MRGENTVHPHECSSRVAWVAPPRGGAEKPVRVPLRKTRIIQLSKKKTAIAASPKLTSGPRINLHSHCTAVSPVHDLSLTRRKATKTRWKR